MNSNALKAGLEAFSRPSMDPSEVMYRYDAPPDARGRGHSELLAWHEVAAAALARIEALEQAEWFVNLPKERQFVDLDNMRRRADAAEQRNDRQAAEILRLQKDLHETQQALRV